MSFHHLDHYATVASPITRIAPTGRLLGAVLIATGAAAVPAGAWLQLALLLTGMFGLAAIARVPARVLLRRLLPPLGFLVLVSGLVLVLAPGRPVAAIGPATVTDTGVARFATIMARGVVALTAAVILVSTTRFTELVESLRELRLPAAITTSLGLAYRFLYILTDEVERLRTAARSRNASPRTTGRRRLLTGITAAALARSVARSERVYQAMLARGYAGRLPTLAPRPFDRPSARAAAALGIVITLLVASAYF